MLRCWQMVAVENWGQCFCIAVLYERGLTASMVTREAAIVLGLSPTKQATKMISARNYRPSFRENKYECFEPYKFGHRGLGGMTVPSKVMYAVPLVARNGDIKTISAWKVGEIETLLGGRPPEDVDEQFPGLRYLSEAGCLVQGGGPTHLLIGMDHSHLMPEHAAESTRFTSQLRLMKSMFGNQHILVGEGVPRLSWCDAMEAGERSKAAARPQEKAEREEGRKLAKKARQEALKHTHKLPRKLWEDKKKVKKTTHPVKSWPQERGHADLPARKEVSCGRKSCPA